MSRKVKRPRTVQPILRCLNQNAAGIDVGATEVYIAVPPDGQTMRNIIKRTNRKVVVVACARKLAVLVWHVLSSGEPFRYAVPKTLEAKYARLRLRATGKRWIGRVPKGSPRSSQYGQGRTRAVPSLPQVLEQNGLPVVTSLNQGERSMLVKKQLDGFYNELQLPLAS